MSQSIDEMRDMVLSGFSRKAKAVKRATTLVKTVLLGGGAFIAGAAAFYAGALSSPLGPAAIAGICGLTAVFLGTLFVVISDEDTTDLLHTANKGLDKAREYVQLEAQLDRLIDTQEWEYERLSALYIALSQARGALEQAAYLDIPSEEALIVNVFEAIKTQLKVALNYEFSDVWSIGVYRFDDGTGSKHLELIAQDRSTPCNIHKARKWPIGVGIAGIAFAKNSEVVAADLSDPKIASAFVLESTNYSRPEDRASYRSMFSVPVDVGHSGVPWGAVVATSSMSNHFGDTDSEQLEPEEAMRALAGVVALCVAFWELKDISPAQASSPARATSANPNNFIATQKDERND